MKTLQVLREAVENKAAKILTIDLANELKGSKICTIYFGYQSQDGIDEFIVGDIVSEYNHAKTITDGFENVGNQALYWDKVMSPQFIKSVKNTMLLLTSDGRNTHIYARPENNGAFTCSDSDRFVYFIKAEDEN